jgi:hypothetical protein
MDRDQAVLALTAELVESRLRAGDLFTTLDISNGLKLRRFPVRHGEVAQAVRKIYDSGALDRFAYNRALIDVNTDNGATITQAYVYLPQTARPADYARRIQDALPPVADNAARDLLACAAPVTSSLLTPTTGARRRGSGGPRSRVRRDGALPVPRQLVRQAGWNVNDTVELYYIPASGGTPSALVLSPALSPKPLGSAKVPVRVWKDLRVRVCRTSLRRAASGDALPQLPLPSGAWTVQGGVIQVTDAA